MNYNAITVTRNKAAHESTFVTQTVKKHAVTLELCALRVQITDSIDRYEFFNFASNKSQKEATKTNG